MLAMQAFHTNSNVETVRAFASSDRRNDMNSIIYIVGLVVVIGAILAFLGLG